MRKMTRLLSFVMLLSLLVGMLGITASAGSDVFTDVGADKWYYNAVMKAAGAGIVAGNEDGSYRPDGKLTWAETITFAVRLDQFRRGEKIYGSADQTGKNWYDIYFKYAISKGIISAAPSAPGSVITRADAAVIFAAVLGDYTPVNSVPDGYFTDVPSGHAAYRAIYDLAKAGVCNGMDKRVFGVKEYFLRREVASIVARMAGLVDKAVLPSADADMAFDALEGLVFTYKSSSLGGTTTLTMGANGAFTGRYLRTVTSETGTDYPKGTRYLCNFSGSFTGVTRVDSQSYRLEVSAISTSALPGREVIQDGVRYISTEPYGFEDAEIFDLFLPGSYTSSMPECLVNALIIANGWGSTAPDRISETVLHNHNAHKALVEDIPAGVTSAKLFSRLEGKTFVYSSGAGAWSTSITFGPDGSFTGEHHDTNMGETGKNYPNGTVYTNTFWGSFVEPTWEAPCKYSLRLRYLYLDNNHIGQESIVDGVRYVVSGAVGFEKAGYFTLYLPGMETAKTPEPMIKWLSGLMSWGSVKVNALPFWTIYNIGGEAPFISY